MNIPAATPELTLATDPACIISVFDSEGDLVSYCLVEMDYYTELSELEEEDLYDALNDPSDSRVVEFESLKGAFFHLQEKGISLAAEDRIFLQ